jgi:hypothetical protein
LSRAQVAGWGIDVLPLREPANISDVEHVYLRTRYRAIPAQNAVAVFWLYTVRKLYLKYLSPSQEECHEIILIGGFLALYSNSVSAAANLECGDPPAVVNESVKGEVQAKADTISKILGAFGFDAAYEKSREDIFSKYDESKAARADQYLETKHNMANDISDAGSPDPQVWA